MEIQLLKLGKIACRAVKSGKFQEAGWYTGRLLIASYLHHADCALHGTQLPYYYRIKGIVLFFLFSPYLFW